MPAQSRRIGSAIQRFLTQKNTRGEAGVGWVEASRHETARMIKVKKQLENHVLELLKSAHLDDGSRRLGLEHHFFFGEWVDALACFDSRLADGVDLKKTWEDELASSVLLDVCFDHIAEAVEDSSDLLAGELCVSGDLINDLGLGEAVFNGGDFLGSHGRYALNLGPSCQDRRRFFSKIFRGLGKGAKPPPLHQKQISPLV